MTAVLNSARIGGEEGAGDHRGDHRCAGRVRRGAAAGGERPRHEHQLGDRHAPEGRRPAGNRRPADEERGPADREYAEGQRGERARVTAVGVILLEWHVRILTSACAARAAGAAAARRSDQLTRSLVALDHRSDRPLIDGGRLSNEDRLRVRRALAQPTLLVGHPILLVGHPILLVAHPILLVAQPTLIVGHPIRFVAQPILIVAPPMPFVAQPTRVVAHLRRSVGDPSRTITLGGSPSAGCDTGACGERPLYQCNVPFG
jgi:hypothetical protein